MSQLPFTITITSGKPAYEQVINAVHKAIATGRLKEGDAFPSVRNLSKEAKINPNTAHKVIQHLTQEGTLEVLPGRGTRIAALKQRPESELLENLDLESIAIEAIRLGIPLTSVVNNLTKTWNQLND